jgi:dTDP-D-glucose 4,6-dehydratase
MAIHVNGVSMGAVSPPRVLVTGGSGFIGRRVVPAVVDEGADYGATKAAAEMLVGEYACGYGMTGCSLRYIPVEHVPPKPGEMPAVIVDISAARALGYTPAHDLKSGLSTVWPEFSEAAK